jgi:biotin carboxyl carrier protein
MKLYKIKVNGKVYEVEVESVTENNSTIAPAKADAKPAIGQTVVAPMQGTILKVVATKGAMVKRGEVLCVLEAMKLENDIVAPKDGVVQDVNVQKDQKVDAGSVLFVLS